MFQRQKLEKEEGKSYNEPGVRPICSILRLKFNIVTGVGRDEGIESQIWCTPWYQFACQPWSCHSIGIPWAMDRKCWHKGLVQ